MSYILDAIKKSDQQRELGTTPDLHTVHEPPQIEPPRRPGWLYGLAAILLLNAAGLGWWLWPRTPVAERPAQGVVAGDPSQPQLTTAGSATLFTPSQQAAKTAIPPLPSVAASAAAKTRAPVATPVVPPPIPASTPPPPLPQMAQPSAQLETNPAIRPAAVQAEAKKPPVISPPPLPPTEKVRPAALRPNKNSPPTQVAAAAQKPLPVAVVPVPTVDDPAARPEEPLDEIEPLPEATDETAGAEAAPGETLTPIAATAPPKSKSKSKDKDSEDPELAKIPLLNQLPTEIQQAAPELHISFHSYSIKPASRLVSISGKILREGEKFDEEVKLVTITKQGVVMSIKDRPFRLKVNPSSR